MLAAAEITVLWLILCSAWAALYRSIHSIALGLLFIAYSHLEILLIYSKYSVLYSYMFLRSRLKQKLHLKFKS